MGVGAREWTDVLGVVGLDLAGVVGLDPAGDVVVVVFVVVRGVGGGGGQCVRCTCGGPCSAPSAPATNLSRTRVKTSEVRLVMTSVGAPATEDGASPSSSSSSTSEALSGSCFFLNLEVAFGDRFKPYGLESCLVGVVGLATTAVGSVRGKTLPLLLR